MDGVFAIPIGPDGAPLKRNNSDVMNNFFIQYAARSFTTIDKIMQVTNSNDTRKQEKLTKHIEEQKVDWEKETLAAF